MKINLISQYVRSIFSVIIHIMENSIFLKKCMICSAILTSCKERYICEKCKEEIGDRELPVCRICSIQISRGNTVCGQCSLKRPPFKRHLSYSIYKDKMRKLILLYKLSEINPLKKYIAELYLDVINLNIEDRYDIIIPVPSDPGRKKSFEPVSEIAGMISKLSGISLSNDILVKKKKYNEAIIP